MAAKRILENYTEGLTLVEGQVSTDASLGVNVEGASIVEFETTGTATIEYISGGSDSYVVVMAGARVALNDVKSIIITGNISYS